MHDSYDGLHFFLESWFRNSMTCLFAAAATHETHLTITVDQCMEIKRLCSKIWSFHFNSMHWYLFSHTKLILCCVLFSLVPSYGELENETQTCSLTCLLHLCKWFDFSVRQIRGKEKHTPFSWLRRKISFVFIFAGILIYVLKVKEVFLGYWF
jgi:hypothetical protein